jgi:glycosyltransferase involved in cell wall biosynthesis
MTATAPLVSILVPAFNAAAYIGELCNSIQAQTFSDFEVLILDDGSADETAAIAAHYEQDRRFLVIRWTQNRGVNAATVELLSRARGEFWCLPGADDVLLPGFLQRRLDLLRAHRDAVLVHGARMDIDESGQSVQSRFRPLELPPRIPGARALSMLLQHNVINTPSVMVRTSVTRSVLPRFVGDWKYAEDWFNWILHAASGFDFLWDSECLHRYRVHSASLSNVSSNAAHRRAGTRLVPLCALSAAAGVSSYSADAWSRWRCALYGLWLLRAAKLRRDGVLRPEWIRMGGEAYYGSDRAPRALSRELLMRAPGAMGHYLREAAALRRQSFPASGLAQIDDPVFR